MFGRKSAKFDVTSLVASIANDGDFKVFLTTLATLAGKRPSGDQWKMVVAALDRLPPASPIKKWMEGFLKANSGKTPSEGQWQDILSEVANVDTSADALSGTAKQALDLLSSPQANYALKFMTGINRQK